MKSKPAKSRVTIERALKEGRIDDVIAGLSILQKSFAREYVSDPKMNATDAIRRAGYKVADPSVQAYSNLHHVGIVAYIDHLKAQRAASSDVTSDYVLTKIQGIVEGCGDSEKAVALRGLELLARHLGMFVERTEISGKDGEAIRYENAKQDADAFTGAISALAKRAKSLPDPELHAVAND